MDFQHDDEHKMYPSRGNEEIVMDVKPRLYHAYNERQFGIHKILKAKQL